MSTAAIEGEGRASSPSPFVHSPGESRKRWRNRGAEFYKSYVESKLNVPC